jgi:hypothetical protein
VERGARRDDESSDQRQLQAFSQAPETHGSAEQHSEPLRSFPFGKYLGASLDDGAQVPRFKAYSWIFKGIIY